MKMKVDKKTVLPAMGVSMAAGAAMLMLAQPHKKRRLQKTAGRAIRAVGDAIEHGRLDFRM